MSRSRTTSVSVLSAALALLAGAPVHAQVGTSITYQAQLKDGGLPRNAAVDLEFRLFDAATLGNQVGVTVAQNNVTPDEGVFTSTVDFGVNAYTADAARWIEVRVRNAGGGGFITLSRQRLTAAPFSLATRGINVLGNGNVGIGTTTPLANAFEVARSSNPSIAVHQPGGTRFEIGVATGPGNWSTSAAADDAVLRTSSDPGGALHLQSGTGAAALTVARNNNVGIGTNAPAYELDVNGSGRFSSDSDYALRSMRSDGTGIGVTTTGFATYIESLTDKTLALNASPTTWGASIWISPTANRVGFGNGNSSPAEVVDVKGNILLRSGGRIFHGLESENTDPIYFQRLTGGSDVSVLEMVLGDNPGETGKDSFYISTRAVGGGSQSVRFVFNSDGNAFKAGTQAGWGTISDQRVKHDIKDLTGGLDRLLSLQGKTFYYNDPNAIGAAPGLRTGFIAQEVETVFPEWVGKLSDGTKTLTIGGGAFEATTVEAIRELRVEKDAQIAELAAENAELQARLERLEALVAAQAAK